jgi:predicted ArsR family transcriptional regulator
MDARELLAADVGVPLGRSRARVLSLLRGAGAPLGVQEVADRSGLHPNTARFHLDALVDAGLATRDPQPRAAPGRPSIGYQAPSSGGPAGERRYRLLAEMLSSLVAGMMPEPAAAAREAGREWGGYLAKQPPPYQRPDAAQAIEELAAILAGMGFAPEVAGEGTRCRMLLHDCPFLEVAQHHQEVVCSLHLGLMQGALARLRAPVTADRLEPFARPGVCVTHLTVPAEPAPHGQPGGRLQRGAGPGKGPR